nr:uncharacterized protein LOC133608870 [Nerophis lumbriciformis]
MAVSDFSKRNLVLLTISTAVPLMKSGAWLDWCFLKSTMISLVLSTFRTRLLVLHQSTRCFTSSLWSMSLLSRMRPTTVVSSAYFTMWLVVDLAQQSWVINVNSSGLRTQPWGEPVLREMLPTLTDWGLSVRKSSSQLHREVLNPRGASLLTKCCGMMVLNAELKSRNNIRTCVSFPSRCSKEGDYPRLAAVHSNHHQCFPCFP